MFDDLVCSTVFVPAAPVASASVRNCHGSADVLPTRVAAGHYRVETPDNLDFLKTSITARASVSTGVALIVDVMPAALSLNGGTRFDIFIRDAADALTDAADYVEVTVRKLPL